MYIYPCIIIIIIIMSIIIIIIIMTLQHTKRQDLRGKMIAIGW